MVSCLSPRTRFGFSTSHLYGRWAANRCLPASHCLGPVDCADNLPPGQQEGIVGSAGGHYGNKSLSFKASPSKVHEHKGIRCHGRSPAPASSVITDSNRPWSVPERGQQTTFNIFQLPTEDQHARALPDPVGAENPGPVHQKQPGTEAAACLGKELKYSL